MAESRGLVVAMELSERQRDAAAQRLGQVRRTCQSALNQLEQLQGYAQETEQKFLRRGQAGTVGEIVKHHTQFMARLDHTIEIQRQTVADHEQGVQEAERELLCCELRLTSLRQVLQRRQHQQLLGQMRREQKETDEIAALRFRMSQQAEH
ncbi:MAG: flagellar export protein FliJ [Curvibacter sp.]|nr:flagellar export protein FliJ [Curvibacter sp.]